MPEYVGCKDEPFDPNEEVAVEFTKQTVDGAVEFSKQSMIGAVEYHDLESPAADPIDEGPKSRFKSAPILYHFKHTLNHWSAISAGLVRWGMKANDLHVTVLAGATRRWGT